MAMAAKPISKPLSMANTCIIPSPSIFNTRASLQQISIPFKPIKLHLSTSSLYSSLPLKKKHDFPVVFVASAQQEEDNTLVIDEEEEGGGEAELSWGESDGGAAVEAQGSDEGEAEPPEDAKVFVGNLPYDATSAELAGIFEQAGVVYSAEVIYNRETGQSRGFGFVVMETVEEAEKAVEMLSRYALRGRTLTINKASPKGVRPERAPRAYEPSFRIYVGNLPWDVDDARLEQLFSEHGKVVNARVVSDRDTGRSRGFGFVTMSTESELNDAIQNLDGQSINGRPIRVNVAEERQRRGGF